MPQRAGPNSKPQTAQSVRSRHTNVPGVIAFSPAGDCFASSAINLHNNLLKQCAVGRPPPQHTLPAPAPKPPPLLQLPSPLFLFACPPANPLPPTLLPHAASPRKQLRLPTRAVLSPCMKDAFPPPTFQPLTLTRSMLSLPGTAAFRLILSPRRKLAHTSAPSPIGFMLGGSVSPGTCQSQSTVRRILQSSQ